MISSSKIQVIRGYTTRKQSYEGKKNFYCQVNIGNKSFVFPWRKSSVIKWDPHTFYCFVSVIYNIILTRNYQLMLNAVSFHGGGLLASSKRSIRALLKYMAQPRCKNTQQCRRKTKKSRPNSSYKTKETFIGFYTEVNPSMVVSFFKRY